MDVFVWGCRAELLRFTPPLFGSGQILAQISQPTSWHIQAPTHSTLCSYLMNTLNRSFDQSRIHWSCSLPFNNLKWIQNCRSGVYSPKYIHTTHSVNNYLHPIHPLFQMLWPSIGCCYEEIMEDLTLLHLFSMEEYSFAQELPCLVTLWFRLISEGFFACIASPDRWGKTGMEFVTLTSLKKSGRNHQYGDNHDWWGRREDRGMVTAFCYPNQAG